MGKNGNIHPSRIFKTPEELEEAFNNYKKFLLEESKKWIKVSYVGKEAQRVEDYSKVPLTMEGFERYCYNNYGCVNHYFDNKEGYYEDFGTICSRIKREIREDQITGGLLGFYNASITQRLNSLSESQEINVNSEPPLFPDVT
tara:strand:+ start:250 stop:678 length:429 start_codon:yes stop_codon:yes gene_type:complete